MTPTVRSKGPARAPLARELERARTLAHACARARVRKVRLARAQSTLCARAARRAWRPSGAHMGVARACFTPMHGAHEHARARVHDSRAAHAERACGPCLESVERTRHAPACSTSGVGRTMSGRAERARHAGKPLENFRGMSRFRPPDHASITRLHVLTLEHQVRAQRPPGLLGVAPARLPLPRGLAECAALDDGEELSTRDEGDVDNETTTKATAARTRRATRTTKATRRAMKATRCRG